MNHIKQVALETIWKMENSSSSEQASVLDIMSLKLDGFFSMTNENILGKGVNNNNNKSSSSTGCSRSSRSNSNDDNTSNHDVKPSVNAASLTSAANWGSTSSLLSSPGSVDSLNSIQSPSRVGKNIMVDCAVCGDKSSGKHYGVHTCEGCKSFFKRSIRRNLEYTCRSSKRCPVDQHHRNQCQYCRLKTCFKVGMKKEAVQRGRQTQQGIGQFLSNDIMNNQSFSSTLLAQLIGAEPFQPSHSPNLSGGFAFDGRQFGNENICQVAGKSLFNAIEWAKNVPFFPTLPVTDQIALLKLGWKELFVLNLGKSATQIHVTDLIPSATIDGWPEYHAAFCDHVKALQYQMDKLKSMQIDMAEYACLKALILFTPDAPGLTNPAYIQTLQEKAMNALESYTKTKYPHQPTRYGKLLLRLSSIRTIKASVIEQLFFVWLFGKTPVETFIQDMLLMGCGGYQFPG